MSPPSPFFLGVKLMKTQDEKTVLAHRIIDLVEETIRRNHPEIEKIASRCEGNTLLYGEVYYDLENEVVEALPNPFDVCLNCDGRRS